MHISKCVNWLFECQRNARTSRFKVGKSHMISIFISVAKIGLQIKKQILLCSFIEFINENEIILIGKRDIDINRFLFHQVMLESHKSRL